MKYKHLYIFGLFLKISCFIGFLLKKGVKNLSGKGEIGNIKSKNKGIKS